MIQEGDFIINNWKEKGRIIAIEDDVVYILMDDYDTVAEGQKGIDICLLSDIGDGLN